MGVNVYLVTGGTWEVQQGIQGLGCFRSRTAAIEWAEANGYKVMKK
jgi:hypothetical protein